MRSLGGCTTYQQQEYYIKLERNLQQVATTLTQRPGHKYKYKEDKLTVLSEHLTQITKEQFEHLLENGK